MSFYLIILYGLILEVSIFIYIFYRDSKNNKTFLGQHRILAKSLIVILSLGIVTLLYARLVEPNILRIHSQEITIPKLSHPLTIAFVSDIHVGDEKKEGSVAKIIQKIQSVHPDIIILGGDYIVNSGTTKDESIYLTPLKQLAEKYPTFAVMGNHEYGYNRYDYPITGDKSEFVKKRFSELGIRLLINNLVCPTIQEQKICLFGNDDVYKKNFNFDELKNWDETIPLIQISHNPDGILYWPEGKQKPDLELAGHTHGGQIWLPLIGPLGKVDARIGTNYYRGLNYWQNIPIFTSVGAGESGVGLRFLTPPEITVITLVSQK